MQIMNDAGSFQSWLEEQLSPAVSPGRRMKALEQIADGIDPAFRTLVETTLVTLLHEDPDPIVRHEAAFVLAKLHATGALAGETALHALIKSALADSSIVVRHEATESLGVFDHPLVRETLRALTNDPVEDVAATARISLEFLEH
jgi:hypothetical protein